jgi:hypothetical protein
MYYHVNVLTGPATGPANQTGFDDPAMLKEDK